MYPQVLQRIREPIRPGHLPIIDVTGMKRPERTVSYRDVDWESSMKLLSANIQLEILSRSGPAGGEQVRRLIPRRRV